ncbi:MAG: hypothetical protein GX247_02725 [Mollicutes bacterium]|nr:hypothetical protein [Mollicutes bacterium]
MLLTIGFLVNQIIDSNAFVEATIRCLYFLSLYSLILYLLKPTVFSYRDFFPHFYNESGLPLFHLGATVLVDNPNYYRLFGIFRESGVFQIFINIALIFELFVREKDIRINYLIIFIITNILTFSTPGYFAMALILILYLVVNRKDTLKAHRNKIKKIIVILLLILTIAILLNQNISEYFMNTLNKFFGRASSYEGRKTSILVELKLWMSKPIFGLGITEGFKLSKDIGSEILKSQMFNTSTFTGLLVTLGVFFVFVFVSLMINVFKKIKINFLSKVIIIFILIFNFSSQLMMYNAFIYSFLFWGLNKKKKTV